MENNISNLFSQFSRGNDAAFSEIYDMYSGDLLRFILKKVDDVCVAEDILHDLFYSLWKKRKSE